MLTLGLNAYHGDSSACLVQDGQLVAAAEEERFRRIKHWAGLPTEAMKYCLKEAGVSLSDIDHIAINRKPGANNLRRATYVLTQRPSWRLVLDRLRSRAKVATVESTIREQFPSEKIRAQIHHIEHHMAHLASAFLVSDFDEAVAVSVDGFGDFASAAWGMGRGSQITIDGRVFFPHSLGIFYSALTQYLGFPHYGDEYKVMGLAPYGQPAFLEQMRQIVRIQPDGTYKLKLKFFRHHVENVSYSWNDCAPEVGALYSEQLLQLLGPARHKDELLTQRHKDIARSIQAMYEEAFFALLNALYQKYQSPNLALSGGCAMNSVANGKVYAKTPFKKMYLPAAAGDAGGAIGAAFIVWHAIRSQKSEVRSQKSTPSDLRPLSSDSELRTPHSALRSGSGLHAYWGPHYDDSTIKQLLDSKASELRAQNCNVTAFAPVTADVRPLSSDSALRTPHSALTTRTAQAVADAKVIGWFQGRMEWGPRALGSRSIVCDPRRADMKDILNLKIKRRESFRPFAPSILREHVAEWFETDDDVPFMMQVFQIRPEKRSQLPAVCHVDGSGRLQTVHQDTNPLYHALITEFHRLTGVPMVLNTSFNENEPVVCKPEEALNCFLRTKMDILVMGNFFIERTA